METLLVCLLAGYGVWLAAYLLWEKRQAKRPASPSDVTPPKRREDVPDIVGKSTFRVRPTTPKSAIPTPQAATKPETGKPMEKEPTFASETENRTSARIPDDKLDEAFEHLEIPDIPLEYEDEDDDYIDEDVPLGAGRRYASGASFEELDAAMKTACDPSADDNQRRQAGRLFGQMQGTEFFDRLVSGSSDIAEKITGLMDYYLSPSFPTAGNAEAAAAAPPIATDAPDGLAGFDIRDFV
ncbi:conjugal transfer protein TraD [Alistipes finegoldii]|uniref:conjugal transfer protein TraD n=1 Tax=Alistipes finegoldii TaxID=214856 RepID=UPI003A92D8FE